jgi:hypothetical protein
MKRIITIAIACITCFTACKKDNENMVVTPAGNNSVYAKNRTQSNIPNYALISYQLTAALPVSNELFRWNSGYLTINGITFDGGLVTGNMVKQEHDVMAINSKTITLSSSAAVAITQLGNMNLPFSKYISPLFGLSLGAPLQPGVNQQASGAALYLSGNVLLSDREVPVVLTIGQLAQLAANAGDMIILSADKASLSASLSLNLNQLTAGIDAQMLNNGQRTNNVIFISATTNQDLYNVILNNFKTTVLKVKLNGEIAPPPVANTSGTTLSAPPPVK